MFDNYLKFYLTNYSGLLLIGTESGFHISIDNDGVKLIGGIDDNTPEQIVKVYDIIIDKLKKLNELADEDNPPLLTEDDLDYIISTAFKEGLGEPDKIVKSLDENGEEISTYHWRYDSGILTRTVLTVHDKDELELMDKNSIEYLKAKLAEAITNEDYMKASEYRDKINNFS